jgi:hypothetical protein
MSFPVKLFYFFFATVVPYSCSALYHIDMRERIETLNASGMIFCLKNRRLHWSSGLFQSRNPGGKKDC